MKKDEHVHVVVLVLGDLGRSPRMQYHALSLNKMEAISKITIIGYEGEKLGNNFNNNHKDNKINEIRINDLNVIPIPIVKVFLKGILLLLKLLYILFTIQSYDLIIIQNPPSLPAVLAAFIRQLAGIVSGNRKYNIIIDWHNLGFSFYSYLNPLRIVTYMLEGIISSLAQGHVCVSSAMSIWLDNNFRITPTVLYDRPSSIFSLVCSVSVRHELLTKLGFTDKKLFPNLYKDINKNNNDQQTIQTVNKDGNIRMLGEKEKVPLIVSSTSWTEDEDFNLLIDSLLELDVQLRALSLHFDQRVLSLKNREFKNSNIIITETIGPRVVVAISGKGPLKANFEKRIETLQKQGKLDRVAVKTVWLEADMYPHFLGSADLGLSLHTSSSGLDLPMKVLDMFGSRVPVLAINFHALPELIKPGVNGYIFKNAQELTDYILHLFFTPKSGLSSLIKLKESISIKTSNWDENWDENMLPLVTKCITKQNGSVLFIIGILLAGLCLLFHFYIITKYPYLIIENLEKLRKLI